MANRRLAVVLGIRPDVIRASVILEILRSSSECEVSFIWSGQHYSDNLKDIFFRELGVRSPDVELGVSGTTDAEITAGVIARLYPVLERIAPAAAVFLGDTNTVMGCVAAAQLNIPIVHIEGCMRSYDWRMPEEKYRTVSDHLSDVIYAYLDEYKAQGVSEGLNPASIVVTGNPIVDVLQRHYFDCADKYQKLATPQFFLDRDISKSDYYLMTCHRRENVEDAASLGRILDLAAVSPRRIFFAASYRTQAALKRLGRSLPKTLVMRDPVGYTEMLVLLTNSKGTVTDSGTVVEEACVLGVPSLQMRYSTERPQVYDVESSVKFDPALASHDFGGYFRKLEDIASHRWAHPFGSGRASELIARDLLERLRMGGFRRHEPQHYHLDIRRSYRGDAGRLRDSGGN